MPLTAIQGQSHACEFIHRALLSRRLHHAYLFTGPAGVGKALTARALAQALLCTQPTETADACAHCNACQRVESAQHADLHILERLEKKDGGRERNIKIAQVRELQRALTFKAFEGKRRVILLLDAECMTPPTANALLKTLEEPSVDTHFILVSDAAHRLLPTIISRCQRVRFSPLSTELIADTLVDLKGIQSTEAISLSRLAEGSLGRAVALAKDDVLEARSELLSKVGGRSNVSPNLSDTLGFAADLARPDRREFLPTAFHLLRTWHRDILALQGGMAPGDLVNIEYAEQIKSRAEQLSQSEVFNRLERLNRAEAAIFERMGNARLVLESLFIHLTDQLEPVGAPS